MASAPALDLDAVLTPIPGENPCGEDLRQDRSPSPVYHQIRDVRKAARAAERQGEFSSVIQAAEAGAWRPITESASEALRTRTKDLELTAWLIESLARTDGFAGLRDGFRIARGLVEQYWDGLYPTPDEDGLETRVAPLTGLNGVGVDGTLIAPISRIPITAGSSVEPLATWSCRQALELARLDDEARQERLAHGATSMDQVQTAVRETPVEHFVTLIEDVEQAQRELAGLGTALDERCGADSPPTAALRDVLTEVLDIVRMIARDVLPVDDAGTANAEPAGAAGTDAAAGGATPQPTAQVTPGNLNTREDALRTLARVADYFRETEPHSPLAFLVERTIRWGRLPLPELLAELIPDESARKTYQQLTGVEVENLGNNA